MARNPDRVCAGGCGRLLWRGSSSLDPPTCRECRRQGRGPAVAIKTCKTCGETFHTKSHQSAYCSQACTPPRESRAKTQPAHVWKWRSLIAINECDGCKALFVSRHPRRYCSGSCLADEQRAQAWEWRSLLAVNECGGCKASFVSRHPLRYCSKSCRGRTAGTTPRGTVVKATCTGCSVPFTYELKGSYRNTCDECRKIATRARVKRAKQAHGQSHHRRRAREYGVPYEPINRKRLFERDGWRCYLCGVKVHMFKGDYADPKQATIDHILAMSNGGGHTWDNVRTCCFRCNSRKWANEITVQLHLV